MLQYFLHAQFIVFCSLPGHFMYIYLFKQVIHTIFNVTAAFGAYIANAFVITYAGNLSDNDWSVIQSHMHLRSTYYSVMVTVVLTYITNALVFIHPYVEKFLYFCTDRNCRLYCKVSCADT